MKDAKPQLPRAAVINNLALAGMVSQIGCITVVIVVGALLAGLTLDAWLGTKPILTVAMLLLSIPVSMYSLIRVALATAAQFQISDKQQTSNNKLQDEQDGDY
jgi:F0F1-type ATP synthase assembly protein I